MDTTLLFAELLITGMQVTVWLSLLVLTVFGYSWIYVQGFTDWQNVALIFFLAFSYALGVAFDRLADAIFEPWNRRLKNKILPDTPAPIHVMRFSIGKDNEYLNRQFEYTRSRMRITRASTINIGLITVFGIVLVLVRGLGIPNSDKIGLCIALFIMGVCIVSLCAFAWRNLTRTYLQMIKANYENLVPKPANKNAG